MPSGVFLDSLLHSAAANDGITQIAVLPGLTNTQATAPQSDDQKRGTWEQQAIKRLGEPEDVTGAVLFLTSDGAAWRKRVRALQKPTDSHSRRPTKSYLR